MPLLSDEEQLVVYRVTQESLSNVVQHAKASHVDVELCSVGRTLLRGPEPERQEARAEHERDLRSQGHEPPEDRDDRPLAAPVRRTLPRHGTLVHSRLRVLHGLPASCRRTTHPCQVVRQAVATPCAMSVP